MIADYSYARKEIHGMYFGVYQLEPGFMRVATQEKGGDLIRLPEQRLERYTGERGVVQLGNVWAVKAPYEHERDRFIHPREWITRKIPYWFWDNPGLPHLLYKGPWNPRGYKNWCRLVHNSTSITDMNLYNKHQLKTGGIRKLNGQLKMLTDGAIVDWRDIVGGFRTVEQRKGIALVCPSSNDMFVNYYGIYASEWVKQKTQHLEQMGYTVEVRGKPGRPQREQQGGKLYERLHRGDVALTVTCHSAAVVESLIAGVPAVSEGAHLGKNLVTPWDEFLKTGTLRTPKVSDVEGLVEHLAYDIYHKTEIHYGSWHQEHMG